MYVSLSKPTLKSHLHECKYRWFTSRCKPVVTLKGRKARLDLTRKKPRKPAKFLFEKIKPGSGMMGRKGRAHDPKHMSLSV